MIMVLIIIYIVCLIIYTIYGAGFNQKKKMISKKNEEENKYIAEMSCLCLRYVIVYLYYS